MHFVPRTTAVLLAMSLAQNIAFARDSVTQPQVEAAARFANAHDFIQTVPDGYDAQIGDTGVRLTAAQRVQIGLARAILAPAKILILDETLSGLEEEAAQVVLANLRREIAGTRTVIALSSYPQSLRGAFESVALLHEGRIVETGLLSLLCLFQTACVRGGYLSARSAPHGTPHSMLGTSTHDCAKSQRGDAGTRLTLTRACFQARTSKFRHAGRCIAATQMPLLRAPEK